MTGSQRVQHSQAALERFADLVARHDTGEAFDFERELESPPELAAQLADLFASWTQLRGLLASVRASPSEIASAECEAGGRALSLDARTQRLLDLLSRFRGSEPRYEVLGEIARGGMGMVLRVRERGVERELALKRAFGPEELTPEMLPLRAQLLRRLLDEAWVLSRLDHPSIVQLHELGIDAEGRVYFTMPLVRGRTLAEIFVLARAGLEGWTIPRALGLLQRVCEALSFAHSLGIVHRDLKPANVMVGRFGELQVMDWGLASAHGTSPPAAEPETDALDGNAALTLGGDVIGTPAYMAPEQALARNDEVTGRADVYSLGAMLYELLCGARPYHEFRSSTTSRALLEHVRAGPPMSIEVLAPGAPPELLAICRKAMQREPAQRYASMEALGEDLRAYLDQRVVAAHEAGAWAEARKWVQRNRALALALAAALLLLVAGLWASLVFEARAQADAAEAQRQKRDVLKLSAFRTLEQLTSEADELWPAEPARVAQYRLWVEHATQLLAQRAEFRASLSELERQGTAADDEAMGRSWWRGELTKLLEALDALDDERTGLLRGTPPAHGPGIGRRLEFAASVAQRSIQGSEAAALWSSALEAIAASPKYGGLPLKPQLGLLPLGADAESGLWEFAHLQSGEPARRGAGGALELGEESGMVFVLLPAGKFWMGSQRKDPDGRNYCAQASANEGPVHEVTLSPFFLSKYEMTQGQWLRCTGANPSVYSPSNPLPAARQGLAHPVEQVSWLECEKWMTRLALALPSEAQWEYGCRAGTQTPWWTGAERESLRGKVNLADRTAARAGSPWPEIKDWPDLEDGWVVHAPVGSYPPNPFGLHEVLGNVWEWCRDGFGPYAEGGELDPLTPWKADSYHVLRGGSYYNAASNARSGDRNSGTPDSARNVLGLRPARGLDP